MIDAAYLPFSLPEGAAAADAVACNLSASSSSCLRLKSVATKSLGGGRNSADAFSEAACGLAQAARRSDESGSLVCLVPYLG